jgi:hypothetical protein
MLRWLRACVAGAALAIALAACAPVPGESTEGSGAMELDAAQAELIALLDRAQESIGGEWESTLSGARPCDLESGSGAQVSQIRGGPPVAAGTEHAVADALLAVFADAGYELETWETTAADGALVVEAQYPLNGKDPEGVLLKFGVSANGSSLQGYSKCVAGDPNAINQERLDD